MAESTASKRTKGAKKLNTHYSHKLTHFAKSHVKALQLGLKTLKQHPLSAWLTILAIGIILVLPLSGFVVYQQIQSMQLSLDRGNQLTVFLKQDSTDRQVESLITSLNQIEEIDSISHQTPSSALAEFEQKTNLGDLIAVLPENPLPHVLQITTASSYHSIDSMKALQKILSDNPRIDKVTMDLDWVEKVEALNQVMGKVVTLITFFISIGCIVILTNTVRLNLEKHRDELTIFSLMGATNAYIRRPFLYRAVIYGLLGAVCAIGLVHLGLWLLRQPIASLAELYQQVVNIQHIPWQAMSGIVVLSLLLSIFSAKLAIWQYNERLR